MLKSTELFNFEQAQPDVPHVDGFSSTKPLFKWGGSATASAFAERCAGPQDMQQAVVLGSYLEGMRAA